MKTTHFISHAQFIRTRITLVQHFSVLLIYWLLLLSTQLLAQDYFITDSYIIQDICSCDIDQDGYNDIVIISTSHGGLPDSLYIFYNDGTGNLFKSSILRRNGIFVKCDNIDDDNFPDIITKDGLNILCIRNNGDGMFSDEIAIAPSQSYRIITDIEDMDGDGWNDLCYNYSLMPDQWGILKNEGDLIFTDHIFDSETGGSPTLSFGNLNDDSLPDASLVFTMEGIHILMNNGDLTFDSLLLCSTKAQSNICNLDQTPPQDILVFSYNTDELILYENLGNGEYFIRNALPLIDPMSAVRTSDLNNDGFDDLFYAKCWWTGCTDSLYIALNDQHWAFKEPQQYFVGSMELFRMISADLNGDNFLDIIMFGYSTQNLFRILWNDGIGGFTFENPVGIKSLEDVNIFSVNISPNPFSSDLHISLKARKSSQLDISIVDLFGKPVKIFKSISIDKNENMEMIWDGRDNSGNHVKSGFYLLQISLNQKTILIKKLVNINQTH